MLQQTTVGAVVPFCERFLARFPTVDALAAAPLEAVLAAWAGLGYYARARNLHRAARAIVAAGAFPSSAAALARLPGIGAYTAAAVAAIAFGEAVVPLDANATRVLARLFAIDAEAAAARRLLAEPAALLAAQAAALGRSGDFAQALFDLGAGVCAPDAPACLRCPWGEDCAARRQGIAALLPRRRPKPERPWRYGVCFWLSDGRAVLLRRRPPAGLLGGMCELPGTEWRATPWDERAALAAAPMPAAWQKAGCIRHGFTHFRLELAVYAANVRRIDGEGFRQPLASLAAAALPSVMRKCAALAETKLR